MSSKKSARGVGSDSVVPTAFAALVLLATNDQLLKPTYHNVVTGKASDVAGLVLVPLVLLVGLQLLPPFRRSGPPEATILALCMATGIGFVSIQLIEPASALFESVLTSIGPGRAKNTMDPSDLLALPVLWLPFRIATRSRSCGPTSPTDAEP